MATYIELLDIASTPSGDALRRRLRIAVVVAADLIRQETPGTPERRAWARTALENPDAAARQMEWAVLAQNRAATVAQITGASDADVQNAVNSAVNLVAGV
jgi:hypothetical protein